MGDWWVDQVDCVFLSENDETNQITNTTTAHGDDTRDGLMHALASSAEGLRFTEL